MAARRSALLHEHAIVISWRKRSIQPGPFGSITDAGGILDRPLSRAMTSHRLACRRRVTMIADEDLQGSTAATRTANVQGSIPPRRLAAGDLLSRSGYPRARSA